MNDSHFHYVDPKLPKGRGEGQKDHPDNLTEDLRPRFDCEHCIATGQGEPRKRPEKLTRRERELEGMLADKDREIAALRAQIEGRPDLGTGIGNAGSSVDPDEAEWRRREREEDEERERKKAERAAEAAARAAKKEK